MSKFGMYTKFVARSGQRDRLVAQLLRAASLLEDTDGCALYIVNVSPDDTDAVWITEVWDSEEQHGASLSMEGVPALIAETLPLLADPPERIRVAPVGGKGLAA